MRFTDRYGPRCVAMYPAIAVAVLLAMGLGFVPHDHFLAFAVLGALLISGGHFGILSISGIFYPSSIRASGAGWATSVSKLGAILGPLIGAAVLSSGMPIVRSYALLAVCRCRWALAHSESRRSCAVHLKVLRRRTDRLADFTTV